MALVLAVQALLLALVLLILTVLTDVANTALVLKVHSLVLKLQDAGHQAELNQLYGTFCRVWAAGGQDTLTTISLGGNDCQA